MRPEATFNSSAVGSSALIDSKTIRLVVVENKPLAVNRQASCCLLVSHAADLRKLHRVSGHVVAALRHTSCTACKAEEMVDSLWSGAKNRK